jgi:hypothetical protein
MVLLRSVFIAQLVLMLPVFAVLLVTPVTHVTGAIYFYLLPIGLMIALYAVWQYTKHPDRRRLAAATLSTPLLCLGLPVVVYFVFGGPLPPAVVVVAVLALIAITIVALLGTTDQWRGTGLFASTRFNNGCLMALVALLLMLWFPLIAGLAAGESISLPSDIVERDKILGAAVLYLIAVAIPAICLSLFTLLYAPVGLVRNPGGRVVHVGQLLAALLLLATLATAAFAVFIFMINPG